MFAELGWLAVPFAEEFGGFGDEVDLSVVFEEFGKAIVVERISQYCSWRWSSKTC